MSGNLVSQTPREQRALLFDLVDQDAPSPYVVVDSDIYAGLLDIRSSALALLDVLRSLPKGPQHDAMVMLDAAFRKGGAK